MALRPPATHSWRVSLASALLAGPWPLLSFCLSCKHGGLHRRKRGQLGHIPGRAGTGHHGEAILGAEWFSAGTWEQRDELRVCVCVHVAGA